MLACVSDRSVSPFLIFTISCLSGAGTVWAQGRGPVEPPVPPANPTSDPLLRGFEFRSVVPATMMGGIDDIAVADKDAMRNCAGYADAGLGQPSDCADTCE